jgi:hypothetical protein
LLNDLKIADRTFPTTTTSSSSFKRSSCGSKKVHLIPMVLDPQFPLLTNSVRSTLLLHLDQQLHKLTTYHLPHLTLVQLPLLLLLLLLFLSHCLPITILSLLLLPSHKLIPLPQLIQHNILLHQQVQLKRFLLLPPPLLLLLHCFHLHKLPPP